VVSNKIETACCDPALKGLAMPASVASGLNAAGGIRGLTRGIPSETQLRKEAKRRQSLADHTRLKILWALSKMDLCPCVLKVVAKIPDSKLSYHLKILESEKLIKARRKGNWRVYSITNEGKESLVYDKAEHH
jgi:ArsR family transcriptional regulator